MSELPKPGEVWGVPDKPETWRLMQPVEEDTHFGWNAFAKDGMRFCYRADFPKDYVRIIPKDTP